MNNWIQNTVKLAKYYKSLGDSTFSQLSDEDLFWQFSEDNNNIAMIVNHLSGNMLSRWTNFLTEDGEKSWRNRDSEFKDLIKSRSELLEKWQKGWDCFLSALESLNDSDLDKIVYIRNEGHTVADAIQRQMSHYPYHIGQIVHIGKQRKGSNWVSLSIPIGNSDQYNQIKFDKEKSNSHFTDKI